MESANAMEITFELSDDDLEYFRDIMRKALDRAGTPEQDQIIGNARDLLSRVT